MLSTPMSASFVVHGRCYILLQHQAGDSILGNRRIHIPGPRQYAPGEVGHRFEALRCQETRHLETARSRAADHHRAVVRIEFVEAGRDLADGNVHETRGNGSLLRLPILADIEQDHVDAGLAALQEFLRADFPDHQNTKPGGAGALISGSTTVSNRLSRIHSLSSTRRTRMASITGATPTIENNRPPTRNAFLNRVS